MGRVSGTKYLLVSARHLVEFFKLYYTYNWPASETLLGIGHDYIIVFQVY